MCKRVASVSLFTALGVISAGGLVPPAWAKPPKLSTVELAVNRCAGLAPGTTKRCPPQDGFSVIHTHTDLSDFRLVVQEEKNFQIFLEPNGCDEARYEAPLQWRLYEGEPFAVIQPVQCNAPQPAATSKPAKPRTVYVVRGLPGFEELHLELESTKHKNPAKDATDAADRFLKSRWPQLEQQRLVAAKEAAQAEKEDEVSADAEPETKVVPAAERRRK